MNERYLTRYESTKAINASRDCGQRSLRDGPEIRVQKNFKKTKIILKILLTF